MAIDKVLSKPIEAGLVPGVVAVAADDSGVIYEGAFGRRAVGSTEPMTLDSVFRIASMTKAITGTAAMQLVEKGRIGLEQPMGDVLPLVRDVKVLEGFDGDRTPRLRDPKTFSTAPDYVTFTRMLLAGGALDGVEVLKPETVKLMARNAIGDVNVPMVRSNNPALALEVETFPGQVKKWGLTFLINTKDIEGFRSAGSLTWGGVHNTYFWIDLEKRITAVALMQILPIGDPHVQETMIGFERALYAAIA